MSTENKWKDRLLSSSLPLEYEIAKILIKNKFSVSFDYAYKRLDDSLEKEFSFDIKAYGFYPFHKDSAIKAQIDLLVECKYRNPNVSWLFIPDIQDNEYSNFSSKGVVKLIDEFSETSFRDSAFGLPVCETCLKGIEVNTAIGDVHDKGVTHGLNQLLYAQPVLVKQHISHCLSGHIEENYPYIICPILVTTADLRLLKHEFSIEHLKSSDTLDDISVSVPFLKMYSDVYPSFEQHCRTLFSDVLPTQYPNNYSYLKALRKNDIQALAAGKLKVKDMHSDPEMLLAALQNGIGNDLFRETLICNYQHFPTLIKEIKTAISLIGRNLKKIKAKKVSV